MKSSVEVKAMLICQVIPAICQLNALVQPDLRIALLFDKM